MYLAAEDDSQYKKNKYTDTETAEVQNVPGKTFMLVYLRDKVRGSDINEIPGSKRDQVINPVTEREHVRKQAT